MLAGDKRVHPVQVPVVGVRDPPPFAHEDQGAGFRFLQPQVLEPSQPLDILLTQEVVEEVGGREPVPMPVRLETGRSQPGLLHEPPHDADAAAFGLRVADLVKDLRDDGSG